MPISTLPRPFYVPTIDLSSNLIDPSSSEAEEVIHNVREACLSTGFFQLINHGLEKSLQNDVFDAAEKFFKLPFEEKMKLNAKTHKGHRGYDVLASQSYEEHIMPDLKEGFYVGADIPADDPRTLSGRFFMGPNVWPEETHLPVTEFREPCERYYQAITRLTLTVLAMLARSLPHGPHIFDDFVSNTPAAPLRLLHYPPAPAGQATGKPQFGSSAHTDFGAITLLLTDRNPGPEVFDALRGLWVPITPNPDAYVVNVGDMLSKWTGERYKSSLHRVVHKNPTERYSVVFFFDGNLDCSLKALDGSQADEEDELTVEKHMIQRMTQSYGKGEKTKGDA